MNPAKNFLIFGSVFLVNGIMFLVVGLATQLTTFWVLGSPFVALGIVFLALFQSRRGGEGSSASGGEGQAVLSADAVGGAAASER